MKEFLKKIFNKETVKEKIKSPVVWIAVIAELGAIITIIFGENISAEIKTILTSIITILTLFGILNNPNNPDDF